MRITRRQLRRIIREAQAGWGEDDDTPENYEGFEDQRGLAASEYTIPPKLKSFKIPYNNYGYEGRKIIDRDRAWLEFVPKGSPSMTREDMFRAVTLLDSDDEEIGLAMATTHAPKFDHRHLENYDVYSVYATTTG